MRKREEKKKKNLYIILLLLFVVFIGIGYAILSEVLSINSSVKYNEMKWDVGFTAVANGDGTVSSNPTISQDKKTVTISCDLGTSTSSETCIAKATIKNGSTFDIELSEKPTITYDDKYISSVSAAWTSDSASVKMGDTINSEAAKELKITITTKNLTNDMIPSDSLSIPVTVTMNWVETDK